MHFESEVQIPKEGWTQLQIGTRNVSGSDVDELLAQIHMAGVEVHRDRKSRVIIVNKPADPIARTHFESGVVPDLAVRGFTVSWPKPSFL